MSIEHREGILCLLCGQKPRTSQFLLAIYRYLLCLILQYIIANLQYLADLQSINTGQCIFYNVLTILWFEN